MDTPPATLAAHRRKAWLQEEDAAESHDVTTELESKFAAPRAISLSPVPFCDFPRSEPSECAEPYESIHTLGSPQPLAGGTDTVTRTPRGSTKQKATVPVALLALPRPVYAAALRQLESKERQEASGTAAEQARFREERTARRQWLENGRLLQQRADLLSRELLPSRSAMASSDVADLLRPVRRPSG